MGFISDDENPKDFKMQLLQQRKEDYAKKTMLRKECTLYL